MKVHLLIFSTLFSAAFLFSCQKPFLDPNGNAIIYDSDAQRFFESAAITDSQQKGAINTFVIQLKGSTLWTKFMAIYPMVGGTAASISINLKDPRNSDEAYRLSIYGSPIYASSGVIFPTNADYANTHLVDSEFAYNSNSLAYYSLTQNTVDGYDIGCIDNAPPYNELSIYHSSDASDWFGYHGYGITPTVTKGLFMFTATATDVKRIENGVVTGARGSAPVNSFTNKPVLIGIVSKAISGGHRECALASIGAGLTDQQALTFYNIVHDFEISLGR